MKKLVIVTSILMALGSPAFAAKGGEGNNTGCNGQGNPSSPCEPTNPGGSSASAPITVSPVISPVVSSSATGGSVLGSGNSTNTNRNDMTSVNTNTVNSSNRNENTNTNLQGQLQGQAQQQGQNQGQQQSISGSGNSTNVLGQSTNAGNLSNVGNASSLSVSGGNTMSNAGNNSNQSTSVTVNTVDPNSLEVARVNAEATKEAARELSDVKVRNTPSAFAAPLTSSNDTCMGSSSGAVAAPGIGVSFGTTWTDTNCQMLKNSRELWNYGMKEAALALMCTDKKVREALTVTGYKCPVIETQPAPVSSGM